MRMLSKNSLPAVLFASMLLPMTASQAQDLPTRPRSGWDGSNSGPPRRGWSPATEQQEMQRHQQVLQSWQDAEKKSYETRVTPQSVLHNLQAKIQQCHSTGDYPAEAAAWSQLAQTLQYGGLAAYAPAGLDVVTCYKGEVTARLEHIGQLRDRDPAAELAEWERVRPLASAFASREPGDARWPFLVAMSFVKAGPGSYNSARQWFNNCMNSPACQPELRTQCQSLMAQMTAEENRIRREAKARAARERQLAAEREKAAAAAREKAVAAERQTQKQQNTGQDLSDDQMSRNRKRAAEIQPLMTALISAGEHHKYDEVIRLATEVTKLNGSDVVTAAARTTAYTQKAAAEAHFEQYQKAWDDCDNADRAASTVPNNAEFLARTQNLRYYLKEKLHR